MAKVLVVGLNPAWQKVLEFAEFRAGEVNRAQATLSLASGKGINAAKVLRRLGHEVALLQILGGSNGDLCLKACGELGIRSLHVSGDRETRECLTVMDRRTGQATELIEPFALGPGDWAGRLLALLEGDGGSFEAVLFCGSVPAEGAGALFARILDGCAPRVSILDSQGPAALAVLGRVDYVKLNREEYRDLAPALRAAGNAAAPIYLVTAGPGEAAMIRGEATVARYSLPRLESIRNPIGAGDTVAAGLAHGLLAGEPVVEAFRAALAMGSASCLQLAPAEFLPEDYRRLFARVEMLETAAGESRGGGAEHG